MKDETVFSILKDSADSCFGRIYYRSPRIPTGDRGLPPLPTDPSPEHAQLSFFPSHFHVQANLQARGARHNAFRNSRIAYSSGADQRSRERCKDPPSFSAGADNDIPRDDLSIVLMKYSPASWHWDPSQDPINHRSGERGHITFYR